MASAWGDAWGQAWGDAWGSVSEEVVEESQLHRYGYQQVEQTQFRIREGIFDEEDMLDLIALHLLVTPTRPGQDG